MMERRHPAYSDPSFPTNALIAYMKDPKSTESWASPDALAVAIFQLVSRGQRIPIRLPLGVDSWGMIMADIEQNRVELEGLKELSLSVNEPTSLSGYSYLKEAGYV
ncbi:hypothetical protein HK405_005176 [Cladochytrium tenue]|nr:hypothetical protein HK405_005176 [Cladochytrium tenue]